MKVAVIDVGSNTVRMLIASPNAEGNLLFRQVTRLAGASDPVRGLADASMERTLAALVKFRRRLDAEKVGRVVAVGTAALRNASNAHVFLDRVEARTGLRIEVVSGEREALLSSRGMLSVLDPLPDRALLFDVGGGSTELILYNDGLVGQASLSLGAVRLLEDFSDPSERKDYIRAQLTAFFAGPLWRSWIAGGPAFDLVGTAGTVTTLAALQLKLGRYDGSRVNNLIISADWLSDLELMLAAMTPEERLGLVGMELGREEIILPGLELVMLIMTFAARQSLRVSDAGILEGLLAETQKPKV